MEKKTNMIYRYLGNSGLKVSALSWGNWINSKGEDPTYDILKVAYDAGINFFDTAEIYGFGEGEATLGKALKKLNVPRETLVISTKIFKVGMGVNDGLLSRKHIIEGLRNSLKRLQLDYVDVVFCHRPDPNTPLEETCRAMDWLINQGMAFYWGTSEWSGSQIMDAYAVCDRLNLIKPICEQPQYNLFSREKLENEYSLLFQKYKMGTTIWSPLMSGVLTGKYIEGTPKGSRGDLFLDSARLQFQLYNDNKASWDEKLNNLKTIAERLGFSLATLCVAWTIKNPCVSTCILGASRAEQIQENLKALDLLPKLTEEVEAEIEQILGNMPQAEMDWMTFTKKDGWRKRFINKLDI
jgi:voltage-dependent potassium channel beta subunit